MPQGLKGFQKGHVLNKGKKHSMQVRIRMSKAQAKIRGTPEQRFWKRIKRGKDENDCWKWLGSTDTNGYPQISVNKRTMGANRFSYELHNGKIPRGEGYFGTCVLHICDNPKCTNPKHLRLGTQVDNIKDRDFKMRMCRKINREIAEEIRRLYVPRKFSQFKLAKMFGISRGTVEDIILRRTWK